MALNVSVVSSHFALDIGTLCAAGLIAKKVRSNKVFIGCHKPGASINMLCEKFFFLKKSITRLIISAEMDNKCNIGELVPNESRFIKFKLHYSLVSSNFCVQQCQCKFNLRVVSEFTVR